MSNTGATLEHNTPEILAAFNRLLAAGQDLSEPMQAISLILFDASEAAFEAEADPVTGKKWKKLSDVTLARRKKGNGNGGGTPKILQDSRLLRQSITAESGGDFAQIGTNKVYAKTQHFGALKGAFGKAKNNTPIPWGKIEARPFFGINELGEQDILGVLAAALIGAP